MWKELRNCEFKKKAKKQESAPHPGRNSKLVGAIGPWKLELRGLSSPQPVAVYSDFATKLKR